MGQIIFVKFIVKPSQKNMKTKLTLSIIGIINILQALGYTIFAETASSMMFNTGDETQQLAVLFQYAITPAFLMIGLMQFLSRNLPVKDAKNILLAVMIAYLPLFFAFYSMMNSPLTNMGIGDFAIDIVMFSLVVFTYFKPKE